MCNRSLHRKTWNAFIMWYFFDLRHSWPGTRTLLGLSFKDKNGMKGRTEYVLWGDDIV